MSQLISKIFSGVAIKSPNLAFTIEDTSVPIPFKLLDINAHSRLMIYQGDMVVTGDITVTDITVETLNYTFLNPPIVGGGDVVGPAPNPSTDNAIVRWNGITGGVVQNSLVIVDDLGNITTPADISAVNGVFSGTLAFSALSGPLPTGLGDVVGPVSATDNAIALYDGVTGKLIQNSLLTVDGSGNINRSGLPWISTTANNFAAGVNALSINITGSNNTAIGNQSLLENLLGSDNVSIGFSAMRTNIDGTSNVAVGTNALFNEFSGDSNIAIGDDSLVNLLTGNNNIAVGTSSGSALTGFESDNILIGNTGVIGDADIIRIGSSGVQVNTNLVGSLSLVDENFVSIGGPGPITLPNTSSINIISPTIIVLPALTINMPASPYDGQLLSISIIGDITSLTHNGNGNTLFNPLPATIVAPVSQQWYYRAASSAWYPLYGDCSGDVQGPASSTDNAIVRFDGTTGKVIQNSILTVDDSGFISLSGNNYIHQNGGALNFAAGELALDSITGGTNNTAIGQLSLENTTAGVHNTAIGSTTLNSNTIGNRNVGVGSLALENATIYNNNTAVGYNSLNANIADGLTAVGFNSLAFNTTGTGNTAIGNRSMEGNTTGSNNTAIGNETLLVNTLGASNVAIGDGSLQTNTTGSANIAIGDNPLLGNVSGSSNIAIGTEVLQSNTTGSTNIAIGDHTLENLITGSSNIAIGENAGNQYTGAEFDNICIGNEGITGESGEVRIGTEGTHVTTSLSGSLALVEEQYETPLSGATVTILSSTSIVIIDPAGTLATLTINMPASPKDGQLVKISITQDITALTHNGNGNTLIGGLPATITAPVSGTWYFRSADTTWYPVDANAGDIVGPAGSTDEAIARFDGTTGKLLQNSILTLDDTGNISLSGTDYIHTKGGVDNFAAGLSALASVVTGTGNTAIGTSALTAETFGSLNTAVGFEALSTITAGSANNITAIGTQCMGSAILATRGVAVGYSAMQNSNSRDNTASGYNCMRFHTTGNENTAMGSETYVSASTGANNSVFGYAALSVATSGSDNTAIGSTTLSSLTTGDNNIAIGSGAGGVLTTGSDNIYIGSNASVATETGIIRIGTSGVHNTNFQSGIRGVVTGVADAIAVLIDSSGQLGTVSSSRIYKQNIQTMDDAYVTKLMKMNPVSFEYKQDPSFQQYGLIAEEIEEIDPDLISYNNNGEPETVRYHLLDAYYIKTIQYLNKELQSVKKELRELQMNRL